MKMVMWNCRGLGKPLTVHNIKEIGKSHSPEVLFLCETKNNTLMVTEQCHKLGFNMVHCVSPQGMAGGLALAWKEEASVVIEGEADFYVQFRWEDKALMRSWQVFAVHLSSDERVRNQQYDTLIELIKSAGQYYIIAGDFNAISSYHEKAGGRMKTASSIDGFNAFVSSCGLLDLGFVSSKFTWTNRQYGGELIQERLDRCLASVQWV
ncbi:MAG: endonuclease/exonuclease/phosphatase family protein [Pigeon pea little leaf phytoplasma]|nr:endonuclease/exonuclease/phosphatase family protein [Pigeon pea little leaf phytoplasma]